MILFPLLLGVTTGIKVKRLQSVSLMFNSWVRKENRWNYKTRAVFWREVDIGILGKSELKRNQGSLTPTDSSSYIRVG